MELTKIGRKLYCIQPITSRTIERLLKCDTSNSFWVAFSSPIGQVIKPTTANLGLADVRSVVANALRIYFAAGYTSISRFDSEQLHLNHKAHIPPWLYCIHLAHIGSTRYMRASYCMIPGLSPLFDIRSIPEKRWPEPVSYLMLDHNTGYYKIGKSKNPMKREKTLQSEKPTIDLVDILDMDVEKKLHKRFSKQRIRGEWFSLSSDDVISIQREYTNFPSGGIVQPQNDQDEWIAPTSPEQ